MATTGDPLNLPLMALDGERLPSAKFNEAMRILNGYFQGLTADLVAYWPLSEASGTRADVVGNNNLTDNATVTGAVGKLGNASQFTAANSEYLSIADNSDLSMGDIDFTIAGWIYLDTLGADRGVISKWATAPNSEYLVQVLASNQLRFQVSNNGTAATGITNTSVTLAATTWYFFVAWHDSVANTVNLQVNNGTIASTAHTTGVFNGASELRIGSVQSAGQYWNGRIDDTGLWKGRVLTAAQRTNLYNGGAGLAYPF